MTNLEQYSEMIKESLSKTRKKELLILRPERDEEGELIYKEGELVYKEGLSPMELAYKAGSIAKPSINGHRTLVSTACAIGRLVLAKHEDQRNSTEKEVSVTRFKVGYHLLNVLFNNKKAKLTRGKENRAPYTIQDVDGFVLGLFEDEDDEDSMIDVYTRPLKKEPMPFLDFYHPEAAEMVRNVNRSVVPYFEYDNCPLVFQAVNKQMEVPYSLNEKLIKVCNDIYYHHEIFTLKEKSKKLRKDQIAGLKRENDNIMEIANNVMTWPENKFWTYVFMDYRDRAYDTLVWLTKQGNKLSKNLFMMSEKEAIGSEGYFWMLVHASNCLGNDKISIDERHDYALSRLPDMFLWASDPVVNDGWTKQDDPFGSLAVAMELYEAEKLENKYNYETNLIIHWDASCSGLQILAALSKDKKTATICNLTDTDDRRDYYQEMGDVAWESATYVIEEEAFLEDVLDELDMYDTAIQDNEGDELKEAKEAKRAYEETIPKKLAEMRFKGEELKDVIHLIEYYDGALEEATGLTQIKDIKKARSKYLNSIDCSIYSLGRVFWGRPEVAKHKRQLCKRPCMTYLYSCKPKKMAQSLLKDTKKKYGGEHAFRGLNISWCFWLSSTIYNTCRKEMPIATKMMDFLVELAMVDYKKGYKYKFNGELLSYDSIARRLSDDDNKVTSLDIQKLILTGDDRFEKNRDYVEGGRDFTIIAPYTKFKLSHSYRHNEMIQVRTMYKGRYINFKVCIGKNKKVDHQKVKSATSPNIVHMLDAQFLHYVVMRCDYDIMTNHDSFGCSVVDAGRLYEDLRKCFVELFSTDILDDLCRQKGLECDVELGDLDINEVYDNQYCFS